MEDEKGFTLIELLAVIIILGILMMIAIPSVTEYIMSSRKKVYLASADQYLTSARSKINGLEYNFTDIDTSYYLPVECISLEKGGKSPFGAWRDAYIIVTISEDGKYNYYWTSLDSAGYKIDITAAKDLSSNKIKSSNSELDTKVGIEGRPFVEMVDKITCEVNVRTEATRNYGNYILAYEASIGDFVNYDAGTWTTTKAKPTSSTPYTFGGYANGQSKNNTINCASSSTNKYNGWRIWNMDGDKVTLIHAGTPECYYHPNATNSGYKSQYILTSTKSSNIATNDPIYDNVTPRDWNTYLNSKYATKAEGLNGDFLVSWSAIFKNSTFVTDPSPDSWCVPETATKAVFNDVIDNGSFGYYWFSVGSTSRISSKIEVNSCRTIYDFWGTAYMESYDYNKNYGVRPVITLKNRVMVSKRESTVVGTNGTTTAPVWNLADSNE